MQSLWTESVTLLPDWMSTLCVTQQFHPSHWSVNTWKMCPQKDKRQSTHEGFVLNSDTHTTLGWETKISHTGEKPDRQERLNRTPPMWNIQRGKANLWWWKSGQRWSVDQAGNVARIDGNMAWGPFSEKGSFPHLVCRRGYMRHVFVKPHRTTSLSICIV